MPTISDIKFTPPAHVAIKNVTGLQSGSYTDTANFTVYLVPMDGRKFPSTTRVQYYGKNSATSTRLYSFSGYRQNENNLSATVTNYALDYADNSFTYTADLTGSGTTKAEVRQVCENCTTDAPAEITASDTAVNITLTAANGYQFESAPTVLIKFRDYTEQTVSATIAANGLTATVNLDTSSTYKASKVYYYKINAAAVERVAPSPVTIYQNCEHCTTNAPAEITDTDTVINITATAASGYRFNAAPVILINSTQYEFTNAADGLTATIALNVESIGFSNIQTATIYATAYEIPAPQTVTITQNCVNCTTNAPANITDTDTVINITATAASGYRFDVAPVILINSTQYEFTNAADALTATIALNITSIGFANIQTATIYATANEIPQTKPITQNCVNCTTNAPANITNTDTVINITATAASGYQFESAPTALIYNIYGVVAAAVTFEIAADALTATGAINVASVGFANIQTVEINATAAAITPYIGRYGAINVYEVTNENLAQFGNVRFFTVSASDGTPREIDLGKFVSSVKRIYTNLGETVNDVLKCGNYNTQIAVKTPLNDGKIIDCGTVTIPALNNTSVDFNAEISAFLPFVGFVNIPSDYINKTISLQYEVNFITTNAVAKLICNNIVFDCFECNLSNDIIYKTSDTEFKQNAPAFNMQVLKGLQPYIVIKSYTDENKHIYNADSRRQNISALNGFYKISELSNFNAANITEIEYNLIIQKLSDGVIIVN